MIKNNEVSTYGVEDSKNTSKDAEESLKKVQPKQDQRKFSLSEGIPQLLVTADKATLTYKDVGICVNQNGVIIKGKMHLATDVQDIRINGFWTLNPELLTCLPSTVYTPMPVLKYNTPPFAETVARLAAMI